MVQHVFQTPLLRKIGQTYPISERILNQVLSPTAVDAYVKVAIPLTC